MIIFSRKRFITAGLILLLIVSAGFINLPAAHAQTNTVVSGKISLSVTDPVIKTGDVFTVVCRVSASTGIAEADFFVDYNTSVLKFVEGGARATKEVGGVHIRSLGNEDAPVRRTFSLQFAAEKEGTASIFIRNGANVTDGEANRLSLQTDKIEVLVNETGEAEDAPPDEGTETGTEGAPDKKPDGETPDGQPPEDATALSGNARLIDISTNALSMIPDFDPSVRTYDAEVDPNTDTFITKYTTEDEGATVRIKGNKNLKFGRNKVKLIVSAENGRKRKYVFFVTRLASKPEPAKKEEDTPATVSPAAADVQIPLDKEENNGYSIVLYVVIGFLAVLSIALIALVKRQRRELDYIYEEMEEYRETETDRGSGESGIEGSEVRGEDGEFGHRD